VAIPPVALIVWVFWHLGLDVFFWTLAAMYPLFVVLSWQYTVRRGNGVGSRVPLPD